MSHMPDMLLEPMVRHALLEDLGTAGDITSRLVVPEETQATALLQARGAGVASGLQLARLAFHAVDPELRITSEKDGVTCGPGDVLMRIDGRATSLLAAERVALNFAGRLSGIASLTAQFVAEAKGTQARITCTRKTTPGLRLAEKLAVLHGGGSNHRVNLSDAVLIKDNHIAAAGGVVPVLEAVKAKAGHMLHVEIEVDTLDQLDQVLATGGAHVVLLDNFSTPDLAEAVGRIDGKHTAEASGNMTLPRIAEVAGTGVDYISVGALTHSAPVLDLGLDF
ncbi:MAG: carboxylating nicotinate-nucleotide diphosphorylase [Pseudomonadota bacterium]